MLELRLQQEAGARVGTLLPVPSVDGGLQGDINALSGKAVLVRSTSGNYDMGGPAPRDDYRAVRLGANPPPTLNELRGSLAEHVLAACGVPVSALGRADGTLARESWRQFLHGSVEPLARIAAEEIGRKLDVDGLTFKFDALRASDVQGRARAFAGMVGAGLSVDDAGTHRWACLTMANEQAIAALKARSLAVARAVAIDYRDGWDCASDRRGVRHLLAKSVYRHLVRMGVPRRGNLQAARRRAVIVDLYDRFRLTGYQIAQRTGYSYKNVCYHLKKNGRQP